MKRSGNLPNLRLKINTVKRYSSGADPEIFPEEGLLKIKYFCKRFYTIFLFSLIPVGAISRHVLFPNNILYTDF